MIVNQLTNQLAHWLINSCHQPCAHTCIQLHDSLTNPPTPPAAAQFFDGKVPGVCSDKASQALADLGKAVGPKVRSEGEGEVTKMRGVP